MERSSKDCSKIINYFNKTNDGTWQQKIEFDIPDKTMTYIMSKTLTDFKCTYFQIYSTHDSNNYFIISFHKILNDEEIRQRMEHTLSLLKKD